MKILSSHFAAICDKYDSPAPNGSFARRCEAARSSEKNSLTAKIFKYALTAALFLLATAFLIGAAAGYWIIVSRSDVPTSGICSYDSTNLLRYYLADESSDQFGKALDGDLGSASATYDGEFHFPIVSKTPIKKFDGYDKALLPLQFADFNYGGDLTQAYFDDFGYEYVLLTGFSAGAKISPENIKTSAEILKNQSNYTWIAGVPSDAGVYAVRITSLEEVTVVGSSATRSKYGSYIVIYTIAPATATITEAAPLGGSFIVENASSAQSAATMADNSIEGGDGTFIYGVDESGKPLNQGVKVTSLTLGGSSHSVSGYSDISVGSVKNGLNIVLSDNVKSAANHSEADNENFWYTVTASLSGAEAGNYALSNATSLRFRIAPVELNADDIKWYYDGAEATNGKIVVYDGSEHGLTALIDETTVSNRYYAKYGNDESVKSAVKSLIDAINGGSAPLTLGVYTRSNDKYTAAIPSTAKVAKNAGIYLFSADVYLGGERSTDVYLATEATNTLTINAAQLMVNYGSDPVYNGKAQQPTFTLAGLIGNDGMGVNAKVTQGATVVEPINVGSYTLTLSVSGETYLNYVFGEPTLATETSTSHNYKIIPKPVTLTTSNVSNITYDGVVHAPTATYIDVSGTTVNAVTAIAKDGTVINANDVKNAGAYTLTASLKDKTNYVWDDNTTADKTYNWTINKLKITVKVTNANQSATYNGAEPTINTDTTVTLTGSVASAPSFVSNELSFSVTKVAGVNAGTYTLTPSATANSGYSVDNYDITFTTGTFKINKLKITVKVTNANQSATYNGAEPTINTDTTVTLTDNGASAPSFVSNELSFSVTKVAGVNAGTYALTPFATAKSGYSADNYDITFTTGTFTINKAALTVTANSENITYGDDKPTFSVSYSGFVNNENESVLGGSLVLECGYVRYGNAGTYSITPKGLTSGNYAITFESGTLTVSKKQITATISLLSDSIYVTDHVLSVAKPSVAFSGLVSGDTLTVTYTAVNNETTVATTLTDSTTLEKGVYTVNAVFSGDKAGNYDITVTAATLTVKEYDGTVTKVAVPVANTGLVYNASNQDGITHNQANYGDYYTVSGTASATNAGDYSVTVTLKDKTSCVWSDNTTADKTYEWTISKATVSLTASNVSNITYDGVVHAPTATYIDVSSATVNAVAAITKDGTVINANDVKNAGEYTLTASLVDKTNYVWADNNTTADKTYNWTISKANITITPTVTSKTFTYGTEIPKSTISYNIEGTNYNNELTISLVLKDSGSGKICELPSVLDAGTYNVSVTVSGDNIDNYNVKSNEDNFEVTPLEVKFSGIININYTDTDKTLNATLLKKGLVKSSDSSSIENLSMPSFSSAVARTYDSSNDDNKAYTETKDAQGNITSISGEHGYYKVTLSSAFTVGSTYKVTAELNSGNYTFAEGSNTIIVKYKTAKIGNAYYTIEDALSASASGNITLAGDSSGSASYIITSFTKLTHGELTAGYTQEDIDNYFKNYKDCSSTNESINHYTLSGKTLIVPYNANGDERNIFTDSGSFGNVYSALIIPNGVSLNLEKKETNNATLTVAAYVGFNQNISTTLAKEHGVLMNNGNLIVQSGCTINAHGYIKGTGLIELKNGATAVDALSIYDWPGGTAASEFYKYAFPTNAYTIHNISCKTKIYGGAMYKAKVFVYLKKGIEIKLDEEITVIGNSDKHGMFYTNSTDEDTYVLKSVKAVNDINSNIGSRNQESGASAKNNRDLIAVFGNYFDDSVNISKNLIITISLQTSTSVPLPIGYMDVTVSKGTLSLSASDYMILPGATIKVEKGANLVVGNKVDITAVPYNTVSAYGGNKNYTAFSTWNKTKINGRLIVNGTLTCASGANIGGLVECETVDATVILENATTTATYKTMYSTNKPYYASGTLSAIGNTVDGENQNLENTTYKSQEVGSNIVWVKANNIKTITFDSCGGTLISPKTIILTNGNFTIPATNEDGSAYLETPSLDYYTFDGWFTAKDGGNQISVGSIVSSDITLYAHWTPNTYQIVYEWTGNVPTEFTNPLPASYTTGDEAITLQRLESVTVGESTYTFVGWYYDSGCTKKADKIDTSVLGSFVRNESVTPMTLTVYGNWTIAATYNVTIKYVVRLDGNEATVNDANNNPISIDNSQQQFVDGIDNNYTVEITVNGNNLDTSYGIENHNYKYYFAGYSAGSGTNGCTVTQGEEAGKFIIRASNAGEVTIYVEFKTKVTAVIQFLDEGNSNYVIRSTEKYFMPGSKYSDMHVAVVMISEGYDTIEKSDSSNGYKYLEKYAIGVTTNGSTIDISNDPNNETLLQNGDTITVTLYYRKIIKVTLTMSATATCKHWWSNQIDNPNFTITTITLGLAKWSKDNETWQNSNVPEFTSNGSSQFYVLQGSTITVTTDSKICTYFSNSCGKKATLTNAAASNDTCSCIYAGNGTFTITPNGEGDVTVTWSGTVEAK